MQKKHQEYSLYSTQYNKHNKHYKQPSSNSIVKMEHMIRDMKVSAARIPVAKLRELLADPDIEVNKHIKGRSLLSHCLYNKLYDNDTIVPLLEKGAFINNEQAYNINPIFLVIYYGYHDLVKLFLEKGTMVEEVKENTKLTTYGERYQHMLFKEQEDGERKDKNSQLRNNYTQIVQLLIASKFDIDILYRVLCRIDTPDTEVSYLLESLYPHISLKDKGSLAIQKALEANNVAFLKTLIRESVDDTKVINSAYNQYLKQIAAKFPIDCFKEVLEIDSDENHFHRTILYTYFNNDDDDDDDVDDNDDDDDEDEDDDVDTNYNKDTYEVIRAFLDAKAVASTPIRNEFLVKFIANYQ